MQHPRLRNRLRRLGRYLCRLLKYRVYFGKHVNSVPENSLVLFPCNDTILCCGLAGLACFIKRSENDSSFTMPAFEVLLARIGENGYLKCIEKKLSVKNDYLGGKPTLDELVAGVKKLKTNTAFVAIYRDLQLQRAVRNTAFQINKLLQVESEALRQGAGFLSADDMQTVSNRIDKLRDAAWYLETELLRNIEKVKFLEGAGDAPATPTASALTTLKNLNAVLNSIDRLEVRGRDSAGISLLFTLDTPVFKTFHERLAGLGLIEEYTSRLNPQILKNRSISVGEPISGKGKNQTAIAITYKIAAEIGSLGDNVRFIRDQIHQDRILHLLIALPYRYHTVTAHTRWASVGEINEANCHPLDGKTLSPSSGTREIIHVCLNGDIDNFMALKKKYANQGIRIPDEITCDTKIIPIHIKSYMEKGFPVAEAFRLAVNDFEGSHAISMHTDLAPGKIFLALKGSGQAIFIGLAEDHYVPASELYGLVEETQRYIKMDGETPRKGQSGRSTRGQVFIVDQASSGGLDGISAMFYDGTPVIISDSHIRTTPLTSRDIDRRDFAHYFLKEISESPSSVKKTLENRWRIIESGGKSGGQRYGIFLDRSVIPEDLTTALKTRKIKKIILIGQGTAGVAALACAFIMRHYLKDTGIQIDALKSSELSASLPDLNKTEKMNDTILIPISQSGTTTDTNRTVDMMKKRGAWSIAIVNRRDSDLTFKADGVLYTSSGRDIEMSVASTKAFYSQIVAGALLGLYFGESTKARDSAFTSNEIKEMLQLPAHMEKILHMSEQIKTSAQRHAITRTYWAVVGSGVNKAAADEIRIKLSELCYKTISSDFVEDKKHIDLSSEPLIIICAAGSRRNVIGDIIKDTAIFKSHKALPIVITDELEDGFDPYTKDVFHVPVVSEHFAPILNTLVGHLWGYYAALAINEGSHFLYKFKKDIEGLISGYTEKNLDIFEIALEKPFREKIVRFYHEFRKRQKENRMSATIGVRGAIDLTLLLKYLAGRLPVSDFELDFGIKGTAKNMFNRFFEALGESIGAMARPIDAIKHQAKTVTVGTSRIKEKTEGIIFDILLLNGFTIEQLTISNVLVIKNLQPIISQINGSTLYRISGMDLLGEPTDETTIEAISKTGTSASISSRTEQDPHLKGSKKIIVQRGNVYIGIGRKDDRSILVIPIIADDPSRPNIIEHLLLLDISFDETVGLNTKVKALGGKYDHIKNLVQENSIPWDDQHLELVEMKELFGRSAEKIAETIISELSQ